jgi:hypothetical protein
MKGRISAINGREGRIDERINDRDERMTDAFYRHCSILSSNAYRPTLAYNELIMC